MVGFVIVSHSRTLADGVVELTGMMADGVPIRAAGGLDAVSYTHLTLPTILLV